jgi:hypothetical protein
MQLEGLLKKSETVNLPIFRNLPSCMVQLQWTGFEIHPGIPLYLATIDDIHVLRSFYIRDSGTVVKAVADRLAASFRLIG